MRAHSKPVDGVGLQVSDVSRVLQDLRYVGNLSPDGTRGVLVVVGRVVVLDLVAQNDRTPTIAGRPPKGDNIAPNVVRFQVGRSLREF